MAATTTTAEPKPGFFSRTADFIAEVRAEMRKVTWPTRSELYGATFVVVAVTIILCAFLGIADFAFGFVIEHLFTRR